MSPAPAGVPVLESVLAPADARRVRATLGRLADAGLRGAAVTGGVAIACHLARASGKPAVRALNDLDLVVPDAAALPGLFPGFLLAHTHPEARPGSMLVQAVGPAERLRVDVFGAFGGQLARSRAGRLLDVEVRLVAAGDLAARLMALLLDLGLGEAVPAKHARDFVALQGCIDPAEASPAWADHRRPRHPADVEEARREVLRLIDARRDLLIAKPAFVVGGPCPRCRPVTGLDIAQPHAIAAALGLP